MANIYLLVELTTLLGRHQRSHFESTNYVILFPVTRRYDARMPDGDADLLLEGHYDTVTGLSTSPDGNHLLSNSMDCFLRVWDIRPFASNQSSRCEKVISGVHHGAEKLLLKCGWSPDQEFLTAGSADRYKK